MSIIKSIAMGGMIGAFALTSGMAIAIAETVAPAPVLLAAPAEAFPVKSEAPGDTAKLDSTVDTILVAQAEAATDRFVAQSPPNVIAPPHPAAPFAVGKAATKTAVHAHKRTDRVAYNGNEEATLANPHRRLLLIGVSY
jgi:hypothetical protein